MKVYGTLGIVSAVVIAALIISVIYVIPSLSESTVQTKNNSNLKIAVVTDGNFSDNGWGQSSLNAAHHLQEKYPSFTVSTEGNVAIPDIELTLGRYAESGYDLIIAHGVQWGEPAKQIANQYPATKIVVFTGLVQSQPNLASIFPQQQQGSFLLGALAGMMSKTGIIGFVGGEEYPNVINILEGYKQGAKMVNPNIVVIDTFLNDWDSPAKGKEAATSIIRGGADIMFHVADSSGHGVIDAAKEKGIYALGAVQDQNHLAPDTILTSFVLDTDKAYENAVTMVTNGNFTGTILRPGIELDAGSEGQGIVYLAPFHGLDDKIPDSVKERLKDLTSKIMDGTIVVPERLGED